MRIQRKNNLLNVILSQSLSEKFERGTDVTSTLCICEAFKEELIEKSTPLYILNRSVKKF